MKTNNLKILKTIKDDKLDPDRSTRQNEKIRPLFLREKVQRKQTDKPTNKQINTQNNKQTH